jgi:hypothetical protein
MAVEKCRIDPHGVHNYCLTGMGVENEKGKCVVAFCTKCLDRQELVIIPKSAIVKVGPAPVKLSLTK